MKRRSGGRKPIATEQKILQGTFRRGRDGDPESLQSPPIEPPEPPDWLGEYARDEWRRLTRELAALGSLSAIALGHLEAACVGYDTWRRHAAGHRGPLEHEDHTGKKTYWHGMAGLKLYLGILSNYPVTPAGKASLRASEKRRPENPYDKLKRQGGAQA